MSQLIRDWRLISISHSRDSALSRESGKDIENESRVELEESFRTKHFALLIDDDKT